MSFWRKHVSPSVCLTFFKSANARDLSLMTLIYLHLLLVASNTVSVSIDWWVFWGCTVSQFVGDYLFICLSIHLSLFVRLSIHPSILQYFYFFLFHYICQIEIILKEIFSFSCKKLSLKMVKIAKNAKIAKIAIFFHQKSNLLFEYLLNTVKHNPEIFCGC